MCKDKGKHMSLWARAGCAGLVLAVLLQYGLFPASVAQAQTYLGTAQSFGVLGGSTVTNTGPSVIRGDLGVWPGLSITGFPPGVVVFPGTIHPGDAVAQQSPTDGDNRAVRQLDHRELAERPHRRPACRARGAIPLILQRRPVLVERLRH